MLPRATTPKSLKSSVNAPGSAGSSLVTIESGLACDWADAAAASPTRAAQANIIERFFPFMIMLLFCLCPVGGFSADARQRSALGRPRCEPNLPARGSTQYLVGASERGRYQCPR